MAARPPGKAVHHTLFLVGQSALDSSTAMSVALIVAVLVPLTQSVTMVQEVNLGETVVLNCPSNDDNHRFQFWQLHENKFIGPTNDFNREKYKYEVLSGNLTIRAVSSNEHGLYTCVCKHITKNSLYSETIELVVKKDWEELYETDHYLSQMRSLLMRLGLLTNLLLQTRGTCLTSTAMVLIQSFLGLQSSPMFILTKPACNSHCLDTELPWPTILTDVHFNKSSM